MSEELPHEGSAWQFENRPCQREHRAPLAEREGYCTEGYCTLTRKKSLGVGVIGP